MLTTIYGRGRVLEWITIPRKRSKGPRTSHGKITPARNVGRYPVGEMLENTVPPSKYISAASPSDRASRDSTQATYALMAAMASNLWASSTANASRNIWVSEGTPNNADGAYPACSKDKMPAVGSNLSAGSGASPSNSTTANRATTLARTQRHRRASTRTGASDAPASTAPIGIGCITPLGSGKLHIYDDAAASIRWACLRNLWRQ